MKKKTHNKSIKHNKKKRKAFFQKKCFCVFKMQADVTVCFVFLFFIFSQFNSE